MEAPHDQCHISSYRTLPPVGYTSRAGTVCHNARKWVVRYTGGLLSRPIEDA